MNGHLRILVTGTRHTTTDDNTHIIAVLARMRRLAGGAITVVHGACPYGGVDATAALWARSTPGVIEESHPAERARNGKILGPERNSRMVAAGADLCLAFPKPDSRGTWDCLRKAADAGIPVRIYPLTARRPT